MRSLVNVLLVAGLSALLTAAIGWIAVPVAAVVVSLGAKELKLQLQPWQIGTGAALGWGILLIWAARSAAFSELLKALGAVFQVPGIAMLCVALLLPFVLGWSTGFIMNTIIRGTER